MRRLLLLFVLLGAVVVGGCGGDDEATPAETAEVRVYFLLDGKVWPVRREVEPADDLADAAYEALLQGPTSDEEQALGLTTEVPEDGGGELSDAALAQVVYTRTQLAPDGSVSVGDRTYTRGDFEQQTPAVLVESPLAFEEVTSPLTVTGTANTFEATFQYELTDTDGRIVDENFVTATSGSGTRGTFEFTTADYEIPFDGVGALIVFEISAEDGSRINLVEIPLRMSG